MSIADLIKQNREPDRWQWTGGIANGMIHGIGFFGRPDVSAALKCQHCNEFMMDHGWCDRPDVDPEHAVCPGDWIVDDKPEILRPVAVAAIKYWRGIHIPDSFPDGSWDWVTPKLEDIYNNDPIAQALVQEHSEQPAVQRGPVFTGKDAKLSINGQEIGVLSGFWVEAEFPEKIVFPAIKNVRPVDPKALAEAICAPECLVKGGDAELLIDGERVIGFDTDANWIVDLPPPPPDPRDTEETPKVDSCGRPYPRWSRAGETNIDLRACDTCGRPTLWIYERAADWASPTCYYCWESLGFCKDDLGYPVRDPDYQP